MLRRIQSAVIYLLIVAVVAMSLSRVLVATATAQGLVEIGNAQSNAASHVHHSHQHEDRDLGTWDCLKYCVSGAPDESAVPSAAVTKALPTSDWAHLIKTSEFVKATIILTVSNSASPRGPPYLAHFSPPYDRQSVLVRNTRLRI